MYWNNIPALTGSFL